MGTDDDKDAWPDNEILITERMWLLAFKNPQASLVKNLLRLQALREDQSRWVGIPIFPDSDMAERFADGMGQKGDNLGLVAPSSPADFESFLEALIAAGDTHFIFDPEKTRVQRIPISRVLHDFRTNKK